MKDPDGATRVEIELTPNDASRVRRRKGSPDDATVPGGTGHDDSLGAPPFPPEFEQQQPDVPESGPGAGERCKLVVVSAAVAVVTLFIGWALGRAGDSKVWTA